MKLTIRHAGGGIYISEVLLVCRCICTEEREVRAGEEDVNERCEGLREEGESTKEMGVYKWEVTGGGARRGKVLGYELCLAVV